MARKRVTTWSRSPVRGRARSDVPDDLRAGVELERGAVTDHLSQLVVVGHGCGNLTEPGRITAGINRAASRCQRAPVKHFVTDGNATDVPAACRRAGSSGRR